MTSRLASRLLLVAAIAATASPLSAQRVSTDSDAPARRISAAVGAVIPMAAMEPGFATGEAAMARYVMGQNELGAVFSLEVTAQNLAGSAAGKAAGVTQVSAATFSAREDVPVLTTPLGHLSMFLAFGTARVSYKTTAADTMDDNSANFRMAISGGFTHTLTSRTFIEARYLSTSAGARRYRLVPITIGYQF